MEINIVTSDLTNLVANPSSPVVNIALIDIFICFLLTIPIFIAYLVITFIFFKKVDKPVNTKTHGLSRFALGGVLIIFGIIIVDMNIEFVSAMIISLNEHGKLNLDELKPVLDSIFFINFIEHYRNIPFDILVMGNIFCTALYAGAEGVISSFKTLKVPKGMCIELPLIKRTRIKFIFLVWCAIAILASIYTIIIGSEKIEFEVALSYTGVISTLIILMLADRAPSVLQPFSTNTDDEVTNANIANPVETEVNLGESNKKETSDAIDHVSDAAIKVLKKLNPAFYDSNSTEEQQSSGGDL
jgi:hypothetical protein